MDKLSISNFFSNPLLYVSPYDPTHILRLQSEHTATMADPRGGGAPINWMHGFIK